MGQAGKFRTLCRKVVFGTTQDIRIVADLIKL